MINTPTPEEIAQHYKNALESVKVINAGRPQYANDAEWADILDRNKGHLRIMLAKDFWTTEDLTPLQQAAA